MIPHRFDVSVQLTQGQFRLDVSFKLAARALAVVGPSGAGKTSLLNVVAGIARPSAGHARIGAETLFDLQADSWPHPAQRHIGYVFQDGLLFPHMSVAANLAYSNRTPLHSEEGQRIIDMLGIAPLLGRAPRTLSGGERQRVAIGRALLSQPKLLLLDEPLAALDATRRSEILDYILMLRDTLAIPMLLVSHTMSDVARLADGIVHLDRGCAADVTPHAAEVQTTGVNTA
jgi:molybdate transport system ATP-binding protein